MQIDKEQVLQLLRDKGMHEQANQAQQQLPDQVDTDQHADLLSRFNVDPKDLLNKLGGGLGNL